jgi:hypothetical protein
MRHKPGGGLGDRPIRLGQQTRTERDKVPAAPYPRRRYRGGCRTGSVVPLVCSDPLVTRPPRRILTCRGLPGRMPADGERA